MRLYSTKNPSSLVDLKEAVLRGLPPDNGLYMPEYIKPLSPSKLDSIPQLSFQELAFIITDHLFRQYIPQDDLSRIIEEVITFDAPLKSLTDNLHILELHHGPSLAFKDFGARFMAQLMAYLIRNDDRELNILVATSGDTGGAVAHGFLGSDRIRVIILYPSGKVSYLQEKQLTSLGQNITALEVDGTFDDCQALVKKAFLDQELIQHLRLSSANSINIARLIPQSFYYFRAWQQLKDRSQPLVFSIPSGNFGNLTAGLMAKRMGLPVKKFIAATNLNKIVPQYLNTGQFVPKPSIRTISNAMDVGNPSNFTRIIDLYKGKWSAIRSDMTGFYFDDASTKKGIAEMYEQYSYVMDPHGAIGYLALKAFQKDYVKTQGIVLETAHPSKFIDVVEPIIKQKVDIPERLAILSDRPKQAIYLSNSYQEFRNFLFSMTD